MFFGPAITSLRESGHELLCTSRNYREVLDLARLKGVELELVGRHGGAERYEKIRQSANRIFELASLINKFEPDFAISFSSPEASRVAFGLGFRHIGFNDSPHAEAVAKLTIPLTYHLFTPWVIPISAWLPFGISRRRITSYKALDPVAWLKQEKPLMTPKSLSRLSGRNIDSQRKNVLIRVEEKKASYIADKKLTNSFSMIDAVVENLEKICNILLLCRYEDQIRQYVDRYEGKAIVIRDVVDGTSLINDSDVFVGAGGTMTAEASLLGKPTVSISPVRFYVENYLVTSGLVKRASNPKELVKLIKKMLTDDNYRKNQKILASSLLKAMENPIDRMLSYLNISA
jgi:predicted glycosyltransferase